MKTQSLFPTLYSFLNLRKKFTKDLLMSKCVIKLMQLISTGVNLIVF